jgi:hypothetical protein
MDDPTRRCENDTGIETRLPGAPDPKRGPHFFVNSPFHLASAFRSSSSSGIFSLPGMATARPEEFVAARLIDLAGHRDARLT